MLPYLHRIHHLPNSAFGEHVCGGLRCCCSPELLRLSPPPRAPSLGKGLASTSTTRAPWAAPASPPPAPAPTAPRSSSVQRDSAGCPGLTSAPASRSSAPKATSPTISSLPRAT